MITIEVKGLDRLASSLKDLGAQRIPNHVARAINAVAADVQKAMAQETMRHLTVRGNWIQPGTRFGYNRDPASKNKLEARVFTRAPWMVQQEEQTFKTAQKSSLIVPMPFIRSGRTDPRKIRRSQLPKAMGDKLVKIMTKRGPVLFQRMKRAGLRAMWAIERMIRYPRRVHLIDAARKAADRVFKKAIEDQINAAIREQGLK